MKIRNWFVSNSSSSSFIIISKNETFSKKEKLENFKKAIEYINSQTEFYEKCKCDTQNIIEFKSRVNKMFDDGYNILHKQYEEYCDPREIKDLLDSLKIEYEYFFEG